MLKDRDMDTQKLAQPPSDFESHPNKRAAAPFSDRAVPQFLSPEVAILLAHRKRVADLETQELQAFVRSEDAENADSPAHREKMAVQETRHFRPLTRGVREQERPQAPQSAASTSHPGKQPARAAAKRGKFPLGLRKRVPVLQQVTYGRVWSGLSGYAAYLSWAQDWYFGDS